MKRTLFLLVLCCLILPGLVTAQGMTSAAFNGLVTDVDGNPIVGATVTAVHTPTGTVYTAVSRMDGLFNIPAVRVGGPYTVTFSMEPFKTQELKGITLKLGEDRDLKIKLALETIAEEITVIASNPIISEVRTGASQNVSTAIIESMPSIGRSFDDFARLAPQVDSRGGGAFSAAGKSSRYNNIQIDGAVNNDLFGLGSQRHPRPGRADLPRRRAGVPAGHRPLRRPPGRLHRRQPERHHPQRHQHLLRFGLLLRPQPGLRRQGPRQTRIRDLQRKAVRLPRRRPGHQGQAVLLPERRNGRQQDARPPTSSTTAATPTTSAAPASPRPTPTASSAS